MKDFYWREIKVWDIVIWRTRSENYWGMGLRKILEIISENSAKTVTLKEWAIPKVAEVCPLTAVLYDENLVVK